MKRHTAQITLKLPEKQLEFLKNISSNQQRSVSYIIRRLIDEEEKKEDTSKN